MEETFKEGWAKQIIINDEFLKKRPLSYSSLSQFDKTPQHYMHYLTAPRETTPEFLLGGLVDTLILTPDKYEERYVLKPKFGRKKEDLVAEEEWETKHKDKTWITQQQLDDAHFMRDAVYTNKQSSEILQRVTNVQRKLSWTCSKTKLPFVGYLDIEGDTFIADLKTSPSADPRDFIRSIFNFNYDIQIGVYTEGAARALYKFPDFKFIVVEKKAPYGVSVLHCPGDMIKYCKQRVASLKDRFRYCMEKNAWNSSYEFKSVTGEHMLEVPFYLKNKTQ